MKVILLASEGIGEASPSDSIGIGVGECWIKASHKPHAEGEHLATGS